MDAILLAAGNSTRFGGNKLLHEIDGKQMYRIVLEHLYQLLQDGKLENLVVVTQYEEIENIILSSMEEVMVVRNMRPEEGISSSIQLGIEMIESVCHESEACMFCVSDQPYMKQATIQAFIEDYRNKCDASKKIGICAHGNRGGNPVIFPKSYYGELKQLTGDKGGKQIVMKHLDAAYLFPVEEYELEDVDVSPKRIWSKTGKL